MKIRTGFVSNSSSSSFILAIPNDKECGHCGYSNAAIVELVMDLFGDKSWESYVPKTYSGNPVDYINAIDEEVEQLDKDIAWTIKKIETLENLSTNDEALQLFSEWNDISRQSKARWRREVDEDENYKRVPREILRRDIGHLGASVERSRNEKNKLLAKKAKIKAAIDNNQTIYVFEIDIHDSAHSLIDALIKNGSVEVIEKVMT